jgi:hypothetical protein
MSVRPYWEVDVSLEAHRGNTDRTMATLLLRDDLSKAGAYTGPLVGSTVLVTGITRCILQMVQKVLMSI